jgi:hypothetical protein
MHSRDRERGAGVSAQECHSQGNDGNFINFTKSGGSERCRALPHMCRKAPHAWRRAPHVWRPTAQAWRRSPRLCRQSAHVCREAPQMCRRLLHEFWRCGRGSEGGE